MEITINDEKYILLIHKNEDKIKCFLYDGKETWIESNSLQNILIRGKDSNKRIKYDDGTILETLENAAPVSVEVDKELKDQNEKHLKLKYSVQNHPLYFTWYFKKQEAYENFLMCTLLNVFDGLRKENEELRNIVVKKDIEIKQFKTEGAILKRVTVATKPFNLNVFNEKYQETNILSTKIEKIADLLNVQLGQETIKEETKADTCSPQKTTTQTNNDVKLTPRRKRRKILEERQRITVEKLKARGKSLEYESSQSEPLVTSSPEVLERDDPSKLITSLEKQPDSDEVKEQTATSPPMILRAHKESTPSKSEKHPILRKRKKINYIIFESEESCNEDDIGVSENSKKNENGCKIENSSVNDKPSMQEKAQENTSIAGSEAPTTCHSDDIQRIIDEWKELEQRRIADLNNMRVTRNARRIN